MGPLTVSPTARRPVHTSIRRVGGVARGTVPTLLAGALVGIVLPHLMRVTWSEIGRAVTTVPWWALGGLGLLWLAGLWVHTIALSAAMPGLGSGRALLLNLTGSCVSNLAPLGGAAGTVANYSMSRSWGFSRAAFVRWAAVTNVWDTLLKLALPTVAVAWLLSSGVNPGPRVTTPALMGLVGLAAMTLLVVMVLRNPRGWRMIGVCVDTVAARVGRGHGQGARWAARAVDTITDCRALVQHAWGRLTLGKVAYAVLQAALCWGCLAAVGARLPAAVVFAAFAVERVLSVLVITPGATGFVEVGMAACLVALGADATEAAGGVLLYRFYTFAMEIPVGGLGLLWWWHGRSGRDRGPRHPHHPSLRATYRQFRG